MMPSTSFGAIRSMSVSLSMSSTRAGRLVWRFVRRCAWRFVGRVVVRLVRRRVVMPPRTVNILLGHVLLIGVSPTWIRRVVEAHVERGV